jgi:hypothetical protein
MTTVKRNPPPRRKSAQGLIVGHRKNGLTRIPLTADVMPPGFKRSSDLLVPVEFEKPVPPGKLRRGIERANREIRDALEAIVNTFSSHAEVEQIEISIGFNADGKFLGFGVGGDASIKVTIRPTNRK